MQKRWEMESFELIPMRVESEEYNQLLDEMAEHMYRYLCQLCENKTLAPETNTALEVGRTGS